jgi:hypothetical protein
VTPRPRRRARSPEISTAGHAERREDGLGYEIVEGRAAAPTQRAFFRKPGSVKCMNIRPTPPV